MQNNPSDPIVPIKVGEEKVRTSAKPFSYLIWGFVCAILYFFITKFSLELSDYLELTIGYTNQGTIFPNAHDLALLPAILPYLLAHLIPTADTTGAFMRVTTMILSIPIGFLWAIPIVKIKQRRIVYIGIIIITGLLLYWFSSRPGKIFAECHTRSEAAYHECMRRQGLDPEDWQ